MSVLIETSFGPLVVDLFTDSVPRSACAFLKLAKAGV
jgi:peptidyl-prolyl cis-trans isomerase-like 4